MFLKDSATCYTGFMSINHIEETTGRVFTPKYGFTDEFKEICEGLTFNKVDYSFVKGLGKTFGWDIGFQVEKENSSYKVHIYKHEANSSNIICTFSGYRRIDEMKDILQGSYPLPHPLHNQVISDGLQHLNRSYSKMNPKGYLQPLYNTSVLQSMLSNYRKALNTLYMKNGLTSEQKEVFLEAFISYTHIVMEHKDKRRNKRTADDCFCYSRININHLAKAVKQGFGAKESVLLVRNQANLNVYADMEDVPYSWFEEIVSEINHKNCK